MQFNVRTVIEHATRKSATARSSVKRQRPWTIKRGETMHKAFGRADAVARAKKLSEGRRHAVILERDDGAEEMTFKEGSLEMGIKHTGGRRR